MVFIIITTLIHKQIRYQLIVLKKSLKKRRPSPHAPIPRVMRAKVATRKQKKQKMKTERTKIKLWKMPEDIYQKSVKHQEVIVVMMMVLLRLAMKV